MSVELKPNLFASERIIPLLLKGVCIGICHKLASSQLKGKMLNIHVVGLSVIALSSTYFHPEEKLNLVFGVFVVSIVHSFSCSNLGKVLFAPTSFFLIHQIALLIIAQKTKKAIAGNITEKNGEAFYSTYQKYLASLGYQSDQIKLQSKFEKKVSKDLNDLTKNFLNLDNKDGFLSWRQLKNHFLITILSTGLAEEIREKFKQQETQFIEDCLKKHLQKTMTLDVAYRQYQKIFNIVGMLHQESLLRKIERHVCEYLGYRLSKPCLRENSNIDEAYKFVDLAPNTTFLKEHTSKIFLKANFIINELNFQRCIAAYSMGNQDEANGYNEALKNTSYGRLTKQFLEIPIGEIHRITGPLSNTFKAKALLDQAQQLHLILLGKQPFAKGGEKSVFLAYDLTAKKWLIKKEITEREYKLFEKMCAFQSRRPSRYDGLPQASFLVNKSPKIKIYQQKFDVTLDQIHLLPVSSKISLIIPILKIIRNLHQLGIMHGDIKFKNILLNPRTSTLMLIDFGCANKIDHDATSYLNEPKNLRRFPYHLWSRSIRFPGSKYMDVSNSEVLKELKGTPLYLDPLLYKQTKEFSVEFNNNLENRRGKYYDRIMFLRPRDILTGRIYVSSKSIQASYNTFLGEVIQEYHMDYGRCEDIWALGLLFLELLYGELAAIYLLDIQKYQTSLPQSGVVQGIDYSQLFINLNQQKIDTRFQDFQETPYITIIKKMLRINPAERITVAQALKEFEAIIQQVY